MPFEHRQRAMVCGGFPDLSGRQFGARRVNFSDWQTYDAEKRTAELKSIEQAVSGGSMPPGDYTALDHTARLSDDQKQVLLKWAAQPAH